MCLLSFWVLIQVCQFIWKKCVGAAHIKRICFSVHFTLFLCWRKPYVPPIAVLSNYYHPALLQSTRLYPKASGVSSIIKSPDLNTFINFIPYFIPLTLTLSVKIRTPSPYYIQTNVVTSYDVVIYTVICPGRLRGCVDCTNNVWGVGAI